MRDVLSLMVLGLVCLVVGLRSATPAGRHIAVTVFLGGVALVLIGR